MHRVAPKIAGFAAHRFAAFHLSCPRSVNVVGTPIIDLSGTAASMPERLEEMSMPEGMHPCTLRAVEGRLFDAFFDAGIYRWS